jgi:hypothetical protein
MKSEKGIKMQKENGLYDTPFSASTWELEILEVVEKEKYFVWLAKFRNTTIVVDHPIDNSERFKTAHEADQDFLKFMRAQCISVCSKKIITWEEQIRNSITKS